MILNTYVQKKKTENLQKDRSSGTEAMVFMLLSSTTRPVRMKTANKVNKEIERRSEEVFQKTGVLKRLLSCLGALVHAAQRWPSRLAQMIGVPVEDGRRRILNPSEEKLWNGRFDVFATDVLAWTRNIKEPKKNNKKTWPYYQLPHETKSQDIKAEYPTHFPSSHQPSFESTVVIHSIPQHAVSPDSLFPIIPIPMLHFTFVSFLLPLQKSWTLLFCSCIGLFNLARQAALEQNSAFGVDPDFRPLVMGQWDMK